MELRRLRLLHELSRLGTVAAVAEAIAYSPSSVSVQLAQLEREAGAKLLRRVGRNVELTAAGRRLAAYAADALAADEAIRTELASAGDAPGGRLRMTFVQMPALALLPGVLDRLGETAPDLQVEVIQRETAQALDELRSRAVDLVVGIEYDPVPVPRQRDIDRCDLLREDVLLVLHPAHPAIPKRGPVRLADCEHTAWASGHRGTGLDAVVRNVCNRLGGFEPEVRHRSDDGLVLSALVASGRAVTLLPALLTAAVPQITARRLREERLQRTIFTATRTTTVTAPAVLAVRQALLNTAKRLEAEQRDLEVVSTAAGGDATGSPGLRCHTRRYGMSGAGNPVTSASSGSAAYQRLREAIMRLDLAPGAGVSEAQLVDRFGFSKAAVRAGLAQLRAEGLVVAESRRAHVVAPLTMRDVLEIYDLRLQLEPPATEAAAGRIEREELARLQALAEPPVDAEDAQSLERFIAANRTIHLAIVEAAGNRRTVRIVERLLDDSERARRVALRAGAASHGVRARQELRHVLDELAAGDGRRAAELMAATIRAFRDELVESLQRAALDMPLTGVGGDSGRR